MPLPLPLLDDADYAALRKALLQRLGPLTPEWTDHNPSDPGIALLELVAFAAEGLLFRFNQIPESTRLAFLRLLDLPLQPATAARGLVRFALKPGSTYGEAAVNERCNAGSVLFRTTRETPVHPGSVQALARVKGTAPDPKKEPELTHWTRAAEDAVAVQRGFASPAVSSAVEVSDADGTIRPVEAALIAKGPIQYYETRVLDGLAPVNLGETIDQTLWVAWLVPSILGAGALLGPDPKRPVRLVLGIWPATGDMASVLEDATARGKLEPTPGVEPLPGAPDTRPRRTMVWQALPRQLDAQENPRWRALTVTADTTEGLTRPGIVELELPFLGEDVPWGAPAFEDPALAGTDALPPPLLEVEGQDVALWLRAFPADGRTLGPLLRVEPNVAPVVQAEAAAPEYLGRGDGQPRQRYRTGRRPVLVDPANHAVQLQVEEAGTWVDWTHVESLDRSDREDRHFTVDGEAGEIHFGHRGPAYGERVRVLRYEVGGGEEGNVAVGAVNKCANASLEVSNPVALRGGREAESVDQGINRIPEELARRDRAVTAADFRALAEATPGADIGRAEVLPLFDPRTLDTDRAGCVTVIVWPREDPQHPNAPVPDADQRDAVCVWLDERRLVGTELFVLPPAYRRVAVSLSIAVEKGFGIEATRRVVETIMRRYLDPLPPYGPTGRGWPMGRKLRDRELIAAVLQVDGVEYVESLRLAEEAADGNFAEKETVELRLWEVVELVDVQVVVAPQTPPAPGEGLDAPVEGIAVPIPVIRDRC